MEASKVDFSSMEDDFLKSNYVPKIYAKNVHQIDYGRLRKEKIRLLTFDIDETLAGNKEQDPPKEIVTLFENLKKQGFKIILVTNAGQIRGLNFKRKLDVECYYGCEKPLTKTFKIILKRFNVKPHEIMHIGNSIMDDIAGGNSAGIYTCLVDNCSGKQYSVKEEELFRELKKRNFFNTKDTKFSLSKIRNFHESVNTNKMGS